MSEQELIEIENRIVDASTSGADVLDYLSTILTNVRELMEDALLDGYSQASDAIRNCERILEDAI